MQLVQRPLMILLGEQTFAQLLVFTLGPFKIFSVTQQEKVSLCIAQIITLIAIVFLHPLMLQGVRAG